MAIHRGNLREELESALDKGQKAQCGVKSFGSYRRRGLWPDHYALSITIYLMKKLTGMTNRQIGQLFRGISYSAVAKAYQRFSTHMRRDKTLGKKALKNPLKTRTIQDGYLL